MKKVRGAVVLVILVCLAAMSPVTVYAEEPTTYRVSTADAFLDAVDEINAAEGGAYEIVLDDDIDFTGGVAGKSGDFLKLKNNTVTIKGSGHEIILYNTSLFVNGNAVLNLGAEGYDGSLSIKSGDNTRTIIGLNGNAVLNMYDNVSIGGNSFAGGQAGGIQIEGSSKFNMYGGTIHDCINWASVSGGVFIDGNGVFTMNDGKIIDCSGCQGGGVGVAGSGTFVMNDGEIRDCTDNWYGGGGVNIFGDNASFTMNGGKITGCNAASTTYGLGGGIFAYTINGSVELKAGEIANNHAANAGDDVFYYGSGGKMSIGYVPDGMTLTGCGHGIDGWYVDGVLEGEDTLRWNETETETVGKPVYVKKYDIPEGGSVTTAQLALKAAHAVYNYTIEYYIDGKLDETLTEHGTAAAGSLKDEEIPDKCPEGYTFDKREDGEVTGPDAETGGPGSFTVKIYYKEDKTSSGPVDPPVHSYIIKWNNYDGTNLEMDYCTFYQLPTYDGPVPVKPEDENYTYEFIGWDKEIVRVTGDEVYTAQFKAIEKQQPEPVEPDEPENPGENGDKPLLDNPYLDEKENGSEDTNIPKTGDKTEDALILNLMLLSLAALAGAGIHLKKTYRK